MIYLLFSDDVPCYYRQSRTGLPLFPRSISRHLIKKICCYHWCWCFFPAFTHRRLFAILFFSLGVCCCFCSCLLLGGFVTADFQFSSFAETHQTPSDDIHKLHTLPNAQRTRIHFNMTLELGIITWRNKLINILNTNIQIRHSVVIIFALFACSSSSRSASRRFMRLYISFSFSGV